MYFLFITTNSALCTCRFKQIYLGNLSELYLCSYELFLTMTDSITSQNIKFSS